MKTSKRLREAEDHSPPSSKQQKIDEFFTPQVTISNRFAVLENLDAYEEPSIFTTSYVSISEEELVNNGSPAKQSDDKQRGSMETSTDFVELLQLTARTVDYICKSLRVMHNKIESICKQMGNSLNCEYNMDKNDSHSEFKECKRVNTPFFRAATKKGKKCLIISSLRARFTQGVKIASSMHKNLPTLTITSVPSSLI
ncbi:UNVERIFIED_CONTAM: hypothetical protein K2H54_001001 [Gekko kuhli]